MGNDLTNASSWVDAAILQHHTNSFVQLLAVALWVETQHTNRARRNCSKALARLDGRCLTRTVWPKNDCDPTRMCIKRDMLNSSNRSVAHHQLVYLYGGIASRCRSSAHAYQRTQIRPVAPRRNAKVNSQ